MERVVELVRRTRSHPDVRVGSSVRGAIDLVLVARSLAGLRGCSAEDRGVGLDAAQTALSGRLRLHEGSARTSEDVVRELWEQVFPATEPDDEPDGAGEEPGGAHRPDRASGPVRPGA